MKKLDKIFTEEQVEEVSNKILETAVKELKDVLPDKFYNEMSSFLYEHYTNASNDIHKELIEEIVEEFIKDPKDYKFLKLRQKLFNENKKLLISTLTDEAIEKSVRTVMLEYTDKNYYFSWKWRDAIIRLITENWHELKKDKRINNGLLREIDNLHLKIKRLREEIDIFYK